MFTGAGNRAGRGQRHPKSVTVQATSLSGTIGVLQIAPSKIEYGNRRSPMLASTDFVNAIVTPFTTTAVSGGTAVVTTSTANHPGVLVLQSSTTANSGILVTENNLNVLGGEQFDIVIQAPAVFTTVTSRFGFISTTTSADCSNGVYFEMSGSGVVIGKTATASVRSSTATVATLAVSTWYHCRLSMNAASTTATFTIYDDTGIVLGTQSLSTNIPASTTFPLPVGIITTSSGTVAFNCHLVDYMSFGIPNRDLVRGALL